MNGATRGDRLIRFSVFEVNLDSGELFKQGRKIKLQGQPFELLLVFLNRPREVIAREELKQRVWPSDTVVDFDHGLNRAINKIREALGDSAESPHFIETLPRRGYRFIGSIRGEGNSEQAAATELGQVGEALRAVAAWVQMPPKSAEQIASPTPRRKTRWWWPGQ